MIDMAVFLTIFGIGVTRLGAKLGSSFPSETRQEEVAFVAFGLHLGNYFWSGVAKLLVGPFFWTWTLENSTHNLIPYSLEKGALPIGHIPWLAQFTYDTMQLLVVPINAAIVGFQLFAIICVLRLSWLKISTIFYDLLHAGIYVFGGILFWPWIWNNFTILLAARSLRTHIANHSKIACVTTILFSNPNFGLYEAAWLGWFDVADARQTFFVAVTEKERAKVPASFFVSHSFGVSLGLMSPRAHAGHYGFTVWNSARDYNRQVTSGTCPAPSPVDPGTVDGEQRRTMRVERVERFIRAHHTKMVAREEKLGKASYYFFRVHHQPSNPYLYEKFNTLNLKDVVAYELVVESVCHRLGEGQPRNVVVGRTVERFEVR